MAIIQPDGRRFDGAAAIPEIICRLPRWRALTPIFRALLAIGLLKPAYQFVASNREKMGGDGACRIDQKRR